MLLILLAINSISFATGEEAKGEKEIDISQVDSIERSAINYLENYWFPANEVEFESLNESLLLEDNILFNEEMKARIELSNLKALDRKEKNQKIIKEELVFTEQLEVRAEGDIYLCKGNAEKVYTFHFDDGRSEEVSTDSTDIILKFKIISGETFLIDFVDRTSVYFGKDYGINDNKDNKGEIIPYSKNQITGQTINTKNEKNSNPDDLLKEQLKNIESAKELFRQKAEIWHSGSQSLNNNEIELDQGCWLKLTV